MPTRPIRFLHRGRPAEVDGAATTRTVLDWLREDARCTGTKEGCNEGDCGACTVVVAELAPPGCAGAPDVVDGVRLRTTNACLQYLPTLDGKALITVEDLATTKAAAAAADAAALFPDGARPGPRAAERAGGPELHPAQQAMVDCHGSQCGFCTPGFVMSLWAAYEREVAHGRRPSRQALADELSGNLCRCTGYRPILDAGEKMFELPRSAFDARSLAAALRELRGDAADDARPAPDDAGASGASGASGTSGASRTSGASGASDASDGSRAQTFEYRDAQGAVFVAPRTVDAFAAERVARPDARILAGSTDIGLWTNKQLRALPELLFIGNVDALKTVEEKAGVLAIGAAASLEDAWRAVVTRYPTLADVWLRFAGVPLRHSGTMGGNVANGSPIGDSAPILMALDARLVLRRGERTRALALADFYTGYMTNRLEPGEFVQAIEVPLAAGADVRGYKISKRFDCDISAVCAGLAIERDAGDRIRAARLAFGGMAATVERAAQVEAALVGRTWDEAALDDAQAALAADFAPLTDMRASAAYRLRVAQNLLRRFWLETRAEAPLAGRETSVWHSMHHPAEGAAR